MPRYQEQMGMCECQDYNKHIRNLYFRQTLSIIVHALCAIIVRPWTNVIPHNLQKVLIDRLMIIVEHPSLAFGASIWAFRRPGAYVSWSASTERTFCEVSGCWKIPLNGGDHFGAGEFLSLTFAQGEFKHLWDCACLVSLILLSIIWRILIDTSDACCSISWQVFEWGCVGNDPLSAVHRPRPVEVLCGRQPMLPTVDLPLEKLKYLW